MRTFPHGPSEQAVSFSYCYCSTGSTVVKLFCLERELPLSNGLVFQSDLSLPSVNHSLNTHPGSRLKDFPILCRRVLRTRRVTLLIRDCPATINIHADTITHKPQMSKTFFKNLLRPREKIYWTLFNHPGSASGVGDNR